MKLVSLFSGAGGLDSGFASTNQYKTVLANEILEKPAETYKNNFKNSTMFNGSIENLDFNVIRNEEIDVAIGGPPCQDFSILRGSNYRKGTSVSRGRLYSHFIRGLKYIQPKVFVFENVPGLISANDGLAYKTIMEDFSNLNIRWEEVKNIVGNHGFSEKLNGYELMFNDVVDFRKLGLPQIRKRLIIIGLRKDLAKTLVKKDLIDIKKEMKLLLDGGETLFSECPLTPIEIFEGKILPDLQDYYENVMKDYNNIWNEVKTQKALLWKKKIWDSLSFDVKKDYVFFNGCKCNEMKFDEAMDQHESLLKELKYANKSIRGLDLPDGSNAIQAEGKSVIERMKYIPPWENHEFVKGTKWTVKGLMSNIYRRIHPIVPSPTVIAYGGGGTWGYHFEKSRGKLTNRERARLQTFPDNFMFSGRFGDVRAQIGEAVPPLAGKRIAELVETVLHKI